MSELAKIIGCKDPKKTKLMIDHLELGGVESIEIVYSANQMPRAVVTLIDFDITHIGGPSDE